MELLALGILLVIAGAMLRYAVTMQPTQIDLKKAGSILLISGLAVATLGLALHFIDIVGH